MSKSPTPGGVRLRALRELAGKTQLEVELDASLGTGYLQRVESGKVERPERETLERLLAALGVRYTERRDILEMFGYIVDAPLPDETEIAWAINLCAAELNSAVFPAYLLDCAHRLLVWNPIFAKLIGGEGPDRRVSALRLLFDPAYGFASRIANPDIFYPATLRALRTEMQLFHSEAWYNGLIEDLLRTCPLFEQYWTQIQSTYHFAARPLTPLELKLSDTTSIQFRIMAEAFIQDRRFRVIYYLPADAFTMQACLDWSKTGEGA